MNKLFYGDNLEILRRDIDKNSIDLCYIDPPFNSKRNYNQIYNNIGKEDKAQAQAFIDTWEWDDYAEDGFNQILNNTNNVFTRQSIELILGLTKIITKGSLLAYLIHMTLRIAEIYRVLKPTGSFYLHCDSTASHYLKIILDAIFCARKGEYQNEIIWVRSTNPKGSQYDNKKYSPFTDTIFYYTKTEDAYLNVDAIRRPLTKEQMKNKYDRVDKIGDFTDGPIIRGASMGERPNLVYEYKGYTPDAFGWRVEKSKLEEIDVKGNLGWSNNGKPYRKLRPQDDKGEPVGNFWNDISLLNSQAAERLGYPTQKPEALLERIIKASSQEGDIILDAYCGCGTSVSVAQRLKRKWVGIDITYQSISVILKRLEETFGKAVIENIQLNGIPKDMDSAIALANKKDDRTRKEFEKWAVLTYSNNKGLINERKGADHGIDGIAYIMEGTDKFRDVLFSVKSGHSSLSHFRDFCHVVKRDDAALGIYLTLDEPTKPMKAEATKMGKYINPLTEQEFDKVSIVTVKQLLGGERLNIPTSVNVLKKAEITKNNNQHKLDF